jgi:hypothetical protein
MSSKSVTKNTPQALGVPLHAGLQAAVPEAASAFSPAARSVYSTFRKSIRSALCCEVRTNPKRSS